MKTKILLSFFVIAAITFIGLARPAQSTAFNTAIFSDSAEIMTEIQNTPQTETQQEKQEKKKTEKEKKKESTEKKAYVPIKVVTDDKEKKIVLTGKPFVIIKKEHPKKDIVLRVSGKEIELIKDEEGCWTLKAGKLCLIKEGEDKVIKLDKDTEFCIIIDKEKGDKKIQIIKSPEILLNKALNLQLAYKVQIKEGKKTLHFSPLAELCAIPSLGILSLSHMEIEHKKLREKLEELRDKLKKFKESQVEVEIDEALEEALKAVEEALEEMREELEKLPKELGDLHIDIKPGIKLNLAKDLKHGIKLDLAKDFKQIKKIKDKVICIRPKGAKELTYYVDKDGGFQIIIKDKLDSENKARYEETLKELRESLPECYEIESEIDEEKDTITIKITCKKKDEKSKKEAKELAKKILARLKKVERI